MCVRFFLLHTAQPSVWHFSALVVSCTVQAIKVQAHTHMHAVRMSSLPTVLLQPDMRLTCSCSRSQLIVVNKLQLFDWYV